MQVLAQVAGRLSAMHEAGFVHRDVKPGNLLWMPRADRWMVTDFHSSAAEGTHAPLRFRLPYSPPETARAYAAGETAAAAAASEDAWALGVVAFELLTGRPAFVPPQDGLDQVRMRSCCTARARACMPVRVCWGKRTCDERSARGRRRLINQHAP